MADRGEIERRKKRAVRDGCLVALLFVGVCVFLYRTEREERLRVTSPDSAFDAVVTWEYGGGAAGWSELYVYVVPVGGSPAGEPVLWTDDSIPTVRWIGARRLELMPHGPVRAFHPIRRSPADTVDTITVELQASRDSTPPSQS